MQARAFLALLCLLAAGWGPRAAARAAGSGGEGEAPPVELLEFLGEWETDDGQWVAPEDVERMDLPEDHGAWRDSHEDPSAS
ncbi:hypothetical protein G3N55_08625 [Dissulfurirhabdus thermomarina]|uniref:Uncharacterized protein n=1 Tax=Dissulfurirhabdus thermomarina TaxID=1765737 RepID=A0A6N9TS21_DISTH|nr:hypothetical protein [Dissulfurirhabdus thermomarina]NDY42903.1 hypothetical protein [Dissulfurirhabdus thermomarina]NMX24130.1 hypothetical protein [Dissulfurirhabdus thermomarina]